MREPLAYLGVHLAVIAAGGALLYALRLLEPRPRALAMAIGPAFLTGLAVLMPLAIFALVIGIPYTAWTFFVIAALAAIGLAAIGRRRAGARRAGPAVPAAGARPAWQRRFEALIVVALAGYLVWAVFAFDQLPARVDNASFWAPKAIALATLDHLDGDVFASGVFVHPDYPILQPLFEATLFRAAGEIRLDLVHAELWIVFAAFVWTAGWLLRRRGTALAALPALAALALAPGVWSQAQLAYADLTVAALLAAGALALGRWLEDREPGLLVLGGVFLGAAANTKNEGTTFALAILIALALASLARARREPGGLPPVLGRLALPAGITLAMLVPWRLWLIANDAENEQVTPLSDALDPSFLADRGSQLTEAIRLIVQQLADQQRWHWLVPVAVAAGLVACWRHGPLRRVGAFYLLSAVFMGVILTWVFWTDTSDPTVPLVASVDRTVTGIVFVCAACAAHLVSALASGESDDAPD